MLELRREQCCNVGYCTAQEWLVTNGIGGYASGTVSGILTRRYHGLLIAALAPPVKRTLLVTKAEEMVDCNGASYPLYVNRWRHGLVEPDGYRYLERFYLEGTTPVWVFALGDVHLHKRIWMRPGANTTYVRYTLASGARPITLTLRLLVNYRDYHANTHAGDWRMRVVPVSHGLEVLAYDGATPFYLLSAEAVAKPAHIWHRDFYLTLEEYRGFDPFDDHLEAGRFHAELRPGDSITLVLSTHPRPLLDGEAAYAERQTHEVHLVARAGNPTDERVRQLVLAADQFVVRRTIEAQTAPDGPDGYTIIAGYPWFTDWGRDTMISLPGLTLTTGRPEIARKILRTFAHFVDQGMLPNRFPDAGEAPEYNTVDAALWYIEAVRAYHQATDDDALLRELFPILQEIIAWHQRGTRYHIRADKDGLLYAGEAGLQLTWMDVKLQEWVVTPRIGKPVEINALWYNALRIMETFAKRLGQASGDYEAAAARAQAGFARFWNAERGYCYDVLDGPDGDDPSLRPNQLLAVSLPYSPLTTAQQKAVVDICEAELLTPYGLRTLGPDEPSYVGRYGGDLWTRDAAYHQGTVWGWLIGPFVVAHWRVYRRADQIRRYLVPLMHHLGEYGLGTIGEIFDGDPPHAPRGCIAQAWSVAELLRAWRWLAENSEEVEW